MKCPSPPRMILVIYKQAMQPFASKHRVSEILLNSRNFSQFKKELSYFLCPNGFICITCRLQIMSMFAGYFWNSVSNAFRSLAVSSCIVLRGLKVQTSGTIITDLLLRCKTVFLRIFFQGFFIYIYNECSWKQRNYSWQLVPVFTMKSKHTVYSRI